MNRQWPVTLGKLPTGIPGLDEVLGGGLPEYSFNLIAGSPGSGKTTMAHQIAFTNATVEQPALYFTVLGEPAMKMLRYQQQLAYFDPDKVGRTVHFINLSKEVLGGDLDGVLARISDEMDRVEPGIVVVDSFRTVVRAATARNAEIGMQGFVQNLAIHLTSAQATTFLVGEYLSPEIQDNPVFTVADGVLWLYQSVERNSMVRKLQVMKMRGQAPLPGLHVFRTTDRGLEVFPRSRRLEGPERRLSDRRISSGVPSLDPLLGGGIPDSDSVLVAGPSGSGKTSLATQFVAAGAAAGEPGVIVVFEENPGEYLDRALRLGIDLRALSEAGRLKVIYLRPLDLSVDETMLEIRSSVSELGAKRVVIDSLSGFELALAPTFREDFRESLYNLLGQVKRLGVTVLMTVETTGSYTDLSFSPHAVSMLIDDIVLLRYAEIDGELRRVLAVVKMRGSAHSQELRAYEMTSQGLVVGPTLRGFRGLLRGTPEREPAPAGPPSPDRLLLEVLVSGGEGSAEQLARRAGLSPGEAVPALERLVAAGHALKQEEGGEPLYRAAARPLGA